MENRIRQLREERGLTQEQVAALLDLHLTNYNKLENGKTDLGVRRMKELARIFGVDPIEILVDPRDPSSFGMGEPEALPYQPAEGSDDGFRAVIEAACAGRNAADPWVLRSMALAEEGYLPGDILIVDLSSEPRPGDVVCAKLRPLDPDSETLFRIYEPPYLVGTARSARRPFNLETDDVQIRGVVVSMHRRP
jgi:transcriptional regulator with XRE-family HTH domain